MSVGALSKDELEYELQIRGVTDPSTVVQMRRGLRNLGKMIPLSSTSLLIYPLGFTTDSKAIKTRLEEINLLLTIFSSGRESSEYRKVTNKLAFVCSRLQNSQATSDSKKEQQVAYTIEIAQLKATLQTKLRVLSRQSTLTDVSLSPLLASGTALSVKSWQSSDDDEVHPTSSTRNPPQHSG